MLVYKEVARQSRALRKKCPYWELFSLLNNSEFRILNLFRILVRIQSKWGEILTRITPNTDTFLAVGVFMKAYPLKSTILNYVTAL